MNRSKYYKSQLYRCGVDKASNFTSIPVVQNVVPHVVIRENTLIINHVRIANLEVHTIGALNDSVCLLVPLDNFLNRNPETLNDCSELFGVLGEGIIREFSVVAMRRSARTAGSCCIGRVAPNRNVPSASIKVRFVCHTNGKGLWTNEARAVNIVRLGIDTHELHEIRAYFDESWDRKKYGLILTDPQWIKEFRENLIKLGCSGEAAMDVTYNENPVLHGTDFVCLNVGERFVAFMKALKKTSGTFFLDCPKE